jgi:hypothetical protein
MQCLETINGGDTMGKINLGRVIHGGIVAGIIIDIFEFVLNGIILADRWRALMSALNLPMAGTNAIIAFNVLGLIIGIAAVWTYAAIRPRFGEGPGTAFIAALLIWITGYLVADALNVAAGFFTLSMAAILICVGLVEIVVATLVGAYFYRE